VFLNFIEFLSLKYTPKMLVFAVGFIILVFIGLLILYYQRKKTQFDWSIEDMFISSINNDCEDYKESQLLGLPEPVQRYFKSILKEDQTIIDYVRLRQEGLYKSNTTSDWVKIKGEQYTCTEKPAFVWKGETSLFTRRDMYLNNSGFMTITKKAIFSTTKLKNKQLDEIELQKWVCDAVWYPTSLLPNNYIQWLPIDQYKAKLVFKYLEVSFEFLVTFNEIGEIIQMETYRFHGKKDKVLWMVQMQDYKWMNGIKIPTSMEGTLHFKNVPFPYFKYNLIEIDYDNPELYPYENLVN
jgi:hypothetical protein